MIVLKMKSSYLFLEEEEKCSRELGSPVESVQVGSSESKWNLSFGSVLRFI